MMDLTRKGLPNTIMCDGNPYLINTDFRTWIRFEIELRKGTVNNISYLFADKHPVACNISEVMEFARPKDVLPRQISSDHVVTLDYELDSDLIYAAFLGQYGIDLIDIDHLHWHKFLALLKGLNDSTKLAEVMGYRCYKKSNKNEDIYEKLKYAWQIDYFEEENQAQIEEFSNAFKRIE